MISMSRLLSTALAIWLISSVSTSIAADSPPLSRLITSSIGSVNAGGAIETPLITWGGDMATIVANGNAENTATGSILSQKRLNMALRRQDDFKKQVAAYMRGDTPYLRGTMGMINMALDLIAPDPRTRPILIYQLTWSNGGDCLVVKNNIKTARDLKGKTIALQAYGPHVTYMTKILKDAGLTPNDVKIHWTQDLTGTDRSPAEAFYASDVDAAFVIIPDGLTLSSNGAVGTGAEGSVKGARIMLSTKTANRIIADVYAVRADYFESRRADVEAFVHGLLLGEQRIKSLFKNKDAQAGPYQTMLRAAAQMLLDSDQATADAEALNSDCEYAGFQGNVKFFGDANWPRHVDALTNEIQSALISLGMLSQKWPLAHAQWDYDRLRAGLTGIDGVPAPRFKKEAVARVVAQKQAMGTLGEGELFNFEINFQPNQQNFSQDLYTQQFARVVDLASTYGGAIITVEGHSDPHKYNKLQKQGASPLVLKRTRQAAKNLSLSRALAVRDSVIDFAQGRSVPLDDSQFTVIGHGIDQPKFPSPKTKEQWLANMRVVFRLIQIEAEESVFEPLD